MIVVSVILHASSPKQRDLSSIRVELGPETYETLMSFVETAILSLPVYPVDTRVEITYEGGGEK